MSGFCLLQWSLRTGELVCCMELLGAKASLDQVIAAFALLLVRFILYWITWFLLWYFL